MDSHPHDNDEHEKSTPRSQPSNQRQESPKSEMASMTKLNRLVSPRRSSGSINESCVIDEQELGVNMLPPTPKVRAAPSGQPVLRQKSRKSSNEENLLDDDDKIQHSQPVH